MHNIYTLRTGRITCLFFSMKNILLVAVASCILAGCTGYSFQSNLNPNNFKEYYKPSAVDVVTDEDLQGKPYKSKGMVTGLSCQVKEGDVVATDADARTDARLKAVDLNANAIRFKKCVRLENTPACLVSWSCYADALIVEE